MYHRKPRVLATRSGGRRIHIKRITAVQTIAIISVVLPGITGKPDPREAYKL
jgi:hypothetical protein